MSKLDDCLKMIHECVEELPNYIQEEIDLAKPPAFDVMVPAKAMTYAEAISALRAVVPGYFEIAPAKVAVHSDTHVVVRPWEIWDGKTHHEGKTLAEAVAACIRKHTPIEPTIDDAEAEIDALSGAPSPAAVPADHPF